MAIGRGRQYAGMFDRRPRGGENPSRSVEQAERVVNIIVVGGGLATRYGDAVGGERPAVGFRTEHDRIEFGLQALQTHAGTNSLTQRRISRIATSTESATLSVSPMPSELISTG